MNLRIVDIPGDPAIRRIIARWSVAEWGRSFPADTVETYLEQFDASDADPRCLPVVLVAMDGEKPIGTASLVADDELPDAVESGPWVAAVYVDPAERRRGVGAALVAAIVGRARDLGFARVYLYTETGADWYERAGWKRLRVATLADAKVAVLTRMTSV